MNTQTQTVDSFVHEAVAPQVRPLAILQEDPDVKVAGEKYGYTREDLLRMWQDAYDGAMNGFRPSYAAAVTAATRIAQVCGFIGKDEGDLPRDFNIQIVNYAGALPVVKQIQSQVQP